MLAFKAHPNGPAVTKPTLFQGGVRSRSKAWGASGEADDNGTGRGGLLSVLKLLWLSEGEIRALELALTEQLMAGPAPPDLWRDHATAVRQIPDEFETFLGTETIFRANAWVCQTMGRETSLAKALDTSPALAAYLSPERRTSTPEGMAEDPWFLRTFGVSFHLSDPWRHLTAPEVFDQVSAGRDLDKVAIEVHSSYSRRASWAVGNEWFYHLGEVVRAIAREQTAESPFQLSAEPEELRRAIARDLEWLVNRTMAYRQEGWVAWTLGQQCPYDFVRAHYPSITPVDVAELGLTERDEFGGIYGRTWVDKYREFCLMMIDPHAETYSAIGVDNPPQVRELMRKRWERILTDSQLPPECVDVVDKVIDWASQYKDGWKYFLSRGYNAPEHIASYAKVNLSKRALMSRFYPFLFLGILTLEWGQIRGWDRLLAIRGALRS